MKETDNDGSQKPSPGSPASPPEPPSPSFGAAAFSEGDAWQGRDDARLARDGKGGLLPTVDNVLKILRRDPAWNGVIAKNEFSGQIMKRALPPFDRAELGEWSDMDDARLELWLAEHYGVRRLPESALQRGVMLAADANWYHEVKEYLQALRWDEKPRLRYWLHAYLGAAQSDYAALAGSKYLIGAVARIMRSPDPVKVDNVLILQGPQGAGKSSALKLLFAPWFTDAAFEIGSTDGYQIERGMWCVELAELDSFRRSESSRLKAFFSRDTNRYRSPYGRKPVNVVRQTVFAGSDNHDTIFQDETGNRRYFPVTVGYIGLDELREDRDQLWAEALHEYKAGVPWWVRVEEIPLFDLEQEQRYVGDAYEDRIRAWLDEPDVDNGGARRERVTTRDLLTSCLHLEVSKWTRPEQQRLGRIMARIDWVRERAGGGSREWVYVRPIMKPNGAESVRA